jgi:importin subunit beta-1
LVSAIAAIEIPRGEWLDLISNLCKNAGHSEHHIKLASLQTLGFICEELEPQDLSNELKNAIIVALTTSINTQEGASGNGFPATKLAVKALLHSVPYAA